MKSYKYSSGVTVVILFLLLLFCTRTSLKAIRKGAVQILMTASPREDITEINQGESDIHESLSGRNTQNVARKLWPDATVPIRYMTSLYLASIGAMEEARVEFGLRTCINVKDWEGEEDYVSISSLSGCWSKVGRKGGSQLLSLDYRCHYKELGVHEMLHAIGFYHEQNRKDRDDYITVDDTKIQADLLFNFDKLTHLDNQRQAYDLSSLMHYKDTAFSTDQVSRTMIAKDPALQHFISYRKDTFSPSDVVKVNRLYNCGDTLLYSYHCDFERRTICGWVVVNSTWTWMDLSEKGNAVPASLPTTDGTHGQRGKGGYIYTTSNKTRLASRLYKTKSERQCLRLWYKIHTNSTAGLSISLSTVDETSGEIKDLSEPVISVKSPKTTGWTFVRKTIKALSEYRVVIETSSDELSMVAVDDISVLDRPCDTAYVIFSSFSTQLQTAKVGKYATSEVFQTDEGYSFEVQIYLNGSYEDNQGEIAVYLTLLSGPKDDDLVWPYDNRYVRFTVIDQESDPLLAQSESFALLDLPRGRPIEVRFFGGKIMPTDGIFNRRKFVKHDTMVLSIEVKDLTPFVNKTYNLPTRDAPTTDQTATATQTTEAVGNEHTTDPITNTGDSLETTPNGEESTVHATPTTNEYTTDETADYIPTTATIGGRPTMTVSDEVTLVVQSTSGSPATSSSGQASSKAMPSTAEQATSSSDHSNIFQNESNLPTTEAPTGSSAAFFTEFVTSGSQTTDSGNVMMPETECPEEGFDSLLLLVVIFFLLALMLVLLVLLIWTSCALKRTQALINPAAAITSLKERLDQMKPETGMYSSPNRRSLANRIRSRMLADSMRNLYTEPMFVESPKIPTPERSSGLALDQVKSTLEIPTRKRSLSSFGPPANNTPSTGTPAHRSDMV